MSTRTTFRPYTVITSGSMAGDLTSDVTVLQSLSRFSYQVTWTGTTPVGTLSVLGSNDYSLNPDGSVLNAGTWTAITLDVDGQPSSTVDVSGNSGSGILNVTDLNCYAVKLFYDRSSGTGTLNAVINARVA